MRYKNNKIGCAELSTETGIPNEFKRLIKLFIIYLNKKKEPIYYLRLRKYTKL